MTRINTNVSSLVAQNTLGRSNSSLNQALTRLSTGLRINTGADDPAGLIASENLRSDITSIRRAISNTDRASQVIATADSALGQVSSLLNDIRGLVTESANSGALSEEQIAANQLQVDSSLEALNRIAQTTEFQGRRLLDGSLDFLTTAGANFSNVGNLQIDQANLGAAGSVSVDVNVTTAATQATVEVGNLPDVTPTVTTALEFDVETTAAAQSSGTVNFDIVTTDTTQGTANFTTTAQGSLVIAGETIELDATTGGNGGNQTFSNVTVTFGGGNNSATFGAGTLAITVTAADTVATVNDLITAINNGSDGNGGTATDLTLTAALAAGGNGSQTIDEGGSSDVTNAVENDLVGGGQIDLAALEDGTADGDAINALTTVNVNFGAGSAGAAFAGNTLTVDVTQAAGTATLADIVAAIDAGGDIDATVGSGSGVFAAVNTVTANADGADEVTTTETIDITGTLAAGANGNLNISFAEAALGGSNPSTAVFGNATTGYTVQINSDLAGVAIDDIRAAIASIAEVDTAVFNGTPGTSVFNGIDVGGVDPDAAPAAINLTGGEDQAFTTQTIDITTAVGVVGNFNLSFTEQNLSGGFTNVTGTFAGGYNVAIDSSTTVTVDQIRSAIESIAEVGTATLGSGTSAATTYDASVDTAPSTLSVVGAGATTATTGIDSDLVLQLAGATGSEVLSFEVGTSLDLLIDAVNAVSDATGVTAESNTDDTGVVFTSSEYGTDAFIDLEIIEEATSGAFTAALGQGSRVSGSDVVASINGITATGDGNDISINTSTLDLSATLTADFVGTANFTITGGGALFQLGPDVVSNQQARLGIGSVNTAALGGTSGLLYQLGTGGTADLSSDPTSAASIVEEAINQVTSLRGRLGAFQRTSLETNKNALNDTLTNLTEAESSIRDADFAAESAELTRSQILVQSGTQVLAIANSNPQNVLALLG